MNESVPLPTEPWYARECAMGTFLSLGSPVIAELAMRAGLDWVILDLEHGVGTESALQAQLQVMSGGRTASVVRFGEPGPDRIMQALDWCAAGIMVPRAASAAQMGSVIEAAYYAPRGRRGYSYYTRWHGFDLPDAPVRTAPVIIAQIETLEGLDNVEAIAAVEGVTALFVGVGDLTFDVQQRTPGKVSLIEEYIERIVRVARAAGKPAGIFLASLDDLDSRRADGFTIFAVDSDMGMIRAGLLAQSAACRR